VLSQQYRTFGREGVLEENQEETESSWSRKKSANIGEGRNHVSRRTKLKMLPSCAETWRGRGEDQGTANLQAVRVNRDQIDVSRRSLDMAGDWPSLRNSQKKGGPKKSRSGAHCVRLGKAKSSFFKSGESHGKGKKNSSRGRGF